MSASKGIYREIPYLGRVRGVRMGDAIAFRGIPYAAPPTGVRRFAPPEAALPWTGEFDATQIDRIAPQTPSRADAMMGSIEAAQDEDCLTLTIWTPAKPVERAPVMVWLHGGGFVTGSGALPWYDGAALAAKHDVVVVGVNYRLGVLGFLALPDRLPPNLALRDQQTALEWVGRHIAAFGGDPDRVTAFGESGGAHNIASLLTADGHPGFQRAILQSAPLGIGLASPEESRKRAEPVLAALRLDPAQPDLLERLREISIERILEAQAAAGSRLAGQARGDLRPPVLPAEGAPHPADISDFVASVAAGAVRHDVELLIGWTRDEAQFFFGGNPMIAGMDSGALEEAATQSWGSEAAAQLAALRTRMPHATPGELFSAGVTETSFRVPSLTLAREVERRGGRTFAYQFDWSSPDAALGACHCIELPFVFGSRSAWAGTRMLQGADTAAVDKLSDAVQRRWVGFAASGDPGFAPWTTTTRPILHIDRESWVEDVSVPPAAVAEHQPEFTGS